MKRPFPLNTLLKITGTNLAVCVAMTLCPAGAYAGILPIVHPYLSFADSPFSGQTFSYFHLETFEEPGAPTVPGVTYTPGGSVVGPGAAIDSVDGGGNNGHSLFYGCGSCGITFTFNAAALGGNLPTSAGIVWTDGLLKIHFQAYDQSNNLIGSIVDSTLGDYSNGDGNPQHYRFFGATNAGGISSIFISNDGGGIEVDHLQFGFQPSAVPVPTAIWLFGSAVAGLIGFARRKPMQ